MRYNDLPTKVKNELHKEFGVSSGIELAGLAVNYDGRFEDRLLKTPNIGKKTAAEILNVLKVIPVAVKKTYEVEYWSCGIDEKGHKHTTRETAERCIENKGRKPNKNRWQTQQARMERDGRIIDLVNRGSSIEDAANEEGVTILLASKILRRGVSRRTF